MKEKEIVLKFDLRSGEAKVEAKGFRGTSCQDATKFLRNALGEVSDFQKKSEWYETNLKLAEILISNLCG